MLVEQPWPTPNLLVPQNSTVIINCITKSNFPFWAINLGNDEVNLQFQFNTGQKKTLNDNGLFQIESPEMEANHLQLLINDTARNNRTSISCVAIGEGLVETTLLSYSKCP